jgi:uncharacterized phiE125 gp8 family phage protein
VPTIKITDASTEPVSVAEAKLHLRVDAGATDEDALIGALITAARQMAEGELRRTLVSTLWEMRTDAFPDAIALDWPRVLSIESLQYVDTGGALRALDPADFVLDASNDAGPAWLVPAYGKAWPDTRDEINTVRVRYTAGYGDSADDVPAAIRQWILLHVGAMYDRREAVDAAGMQPLSFLCGLLDPYRVFG